MALSDAAPSGRRFDPAVRRSGMVLTRGADGPDDETKAFEERRRRAERMLDPNRRPGAGRRVFNLALCVAIALVGGVGTAYLAIDRGRLFNEVRLGQWTAYPTAGTPEADPYSAATLARTGQVPLGAGEGLAFFGERDSAGAALDDRCDYLISGKTPPARLWTLSVIDVAGRLVDNAAHRPSVDSTALLRKPDGSFTVTASRSARPGNWMPLGEVGAFTFVLRLYDTPLTTGSGLADLAMPEIIRGDCR